MSKQPRQPTQDPPAVRDEEYKGAYGARINQLFRDALRDLKTLKCHPRPSEAKASRGEGNPGG